MGETKLYVRARFKGQHHGLGPWSPAKELARVTPDAAMPTERQKFQASDYAYNTHFGWCAALATDGKTLAIGAYSDDRPLIDAGAVYIFTLVNGVFVQQQKVVPADLSRYDAFGRALDLSAEGNRLIVGSYSDDTNSGIDAGSAYVFNRVGQAWVEEAKFTASDGAKEDFFGYSVAISGDGNTAVCGSLYDDDKGINSGSAYVYRRVGEQWMFECKIADAELSAGDQFGSSVTLSHDGTVMAIASAKDATAYLNDGSVYLYRKTVGVWVKEAKLIAPDGSYNATFGNACRFSATGDQIVIGAYRDRGSKGAVYVFQRTGGQWVLEQKITGSDSVAPDQFGMSVGFSPDGGTIIVGANQANGPVVQAGAVYLYRKEGGMWVEKKKYGASDAGNYDQFGRAVAVSEHGSFFVATATSINTLTAAAYQFA